MTTPRRIWFSIRFLQQFSRLLALSAHKSDHKCARVLVALIVDYIEEPADLCIVAEILFSEGCKQFLKYLGGRGLHPCCSRWKIMTFHRQKPSQTTISAKSCAGVWQATTVTASSASQMKWRLWKSASRVQGSLIFEIWPERFQV